MAKPGLKPLVPAGITNRADDRWAGNFSPGCYYEPGLKGPLVPAAKNAEANAKLKHRSKVCYLVVNRGSLLPSYIIQ